MNILVSNDDGVLAPGLALLADVCRKVGNVTVVAPDREQSGTSHSLTLHRPLRPTRRPDGGWQIDGTPTDCVMLAIQALMTERPDFVETWILRALEYPFATSLTGLSRQGEAIRAHDTRDRLASLRVPTLITTGTEDVLVPPSASEDLHALIPGSELARIPDAGHMHFIEQAPAFNDLCLNFLRKHSP
jgi:pimeloyl-ACP methyl ester carboxylesterase